jgi:CheY-like chemotaxis protein
MGLAMATRKLALCFVDDDPDELSRFKKYLGRYYSIGIGTTFARAVNDLKKTYNRKPDLFVLDMYFPMGANTDAERGKLDQTWEKFVAAENELKGVLASMQQTSKGGRSLAEQAKSRKTPFVFFTRKGNLNDAIEAYENIGALAVVKKPDPEPSKKPRSKIEIKNARDKALKLDLDREGGVFGRIESAIARASPSLSGQAFVAMWFTGELSAIYNRAIKPAIKAAGYRPMIIRLKEHANKIDDEIISEIGKSTFLVADFTGHRGGVYFEAGIAMGREVPVIWTCRKDDIDNLHFDIRQYNCIAWSKPDEFRKRLQKRISHVIGPR